ncbi:hypothetical protein NDU88_011262 [Pleurodeles waltl]|uniref:Exostosin GT47 domain-containing protein n=1 Tax=Pleurodeles waltl TaxID=8319 RepID=A0AAV7S212_PLEWA|nr:hypothetical protein NDU88_011262 [Pleurodeles waltl]
MQAKKRYLLLVSCLGACCCLLLGGCYFQGEQTPRPTSTPGFHNLRSRPWVEAAPRPSPLWTAPLGSYPEQGQAGLVQRPLAPQREQPDATTGHCHMQNCFDFSLCQRWGFWVYVYPQSVETPPPSSTYRKVLGALQASRFYTTDPGRACLFVPPVDTLDRDRLSGEYVAGARARLQALPLWNGGRNHLVFNLYSGSWPDYGEELGLDLGQAMLARASLGTGAHRPGFDVSLPLFPREHPERGGPQGAAGLLPTVRRYLLVFKGKRYLTGIGSETRNALHHLHNGQDMLLLTTCRHGRDWERHQDQRCPRDNAEYSR